MDKIRRLQDEAAQREEHEEMDVQPKNEENLTVETNGKVADESEVALREAEEKNAQLEAEVRAMREELEESQALIATAREVMEEDTTEGVLQVVPDKPKGKPKKGASPQELRARSARLEETLEQVREELAQAQAQIQAKDQQILALKSQLYEYLVQVVGIQQQQIQELQGANQPEE